jgi:FAD binding domain in molybdopterin dehydrogenase
MLHRPKRLAEAIQILADHADAKPLPGGASLVAMLNARLVEPTALVSLSCIEELRRTERRADGTLRIGAMTRHRDVAEMSALTGMHALLQQAGNRYRRSDQPSHGHDEFGRLTKPTLMDHKLPTALDAPLEIRPLIMEHPEPSRPFGTKGVSEPGLIGVPGSIANAVAKATGKRMHRLPKTPERVLDAPIGER